MELLRKVANFTSSIADKKNIYILYIRSILEQSSVVWHSSLTQENCDDLERVQKCAIRIILGEHFQDYEDALLKVDLETLIVERLWARTLQVNVLKMKRLKECSQLEKKIMTWTKEMKKDMKLILLIQKDSRNKTFQPCKEY